MKHFEIAMGVLKQGDLYLLQLRNGKNQAGGINLIGCFGGQIEQGETPLEAACREVSEESSFRAKPDNARFLAALDVISERHNRPITVHATLFEFAVDRSENIVAKEGELVVMNIVEIEEKLKVLTPAARKYFEQIIQGGN